MKDIILQLVERYLPLADVGTKERDMLLTLSLRMNEFTDDKANRWIGFVQGILYSKGRIDINEERDFTRPLFHKYYEEGGISLPPTVDAK